MQKNVKKFKFINSLLQSSAIFRHMEALSRVQECREAILPCYKGDKNICNYLKRIEVYFSCTKNLNKKMHLQCRIQTIDVRTEDASACRCSFAEFFWICRLTSRKAVDMN